LHLSGESPGIGSLAPPARGWTSGNRSGWGPRGFPFPSLLHPLLVEPETAMMYPIGSAATVSGIPQHKLDLWCKDGYVIPYGPGASGRPRLFTLMQIVGIAVSWELYTSERSCNPRYIRAITDTFNETDEKALEALFDRGRTHFILIT